MIGKLLIAILFCFSTLKVVCEASPASPVGEEDFLHIVVSSVSDSNDVDTLTSQRILEPRKTGSNILYRTIVRTLLDVPQGQHTPQGSSYVSKTPSIQNENAAKGNFKDLPSDDHGQKRRQSRHRKLGVTGHEWSSRYGTSKVSQQEMADIRPAMKKSSGLRWNVAMDQENGYKYGKRKRNKKKERADSRTEEVPTGLDSPPLVTGILKGILVLLFSVTCVVLLWFTRQNCKRKSRRTNDSELNSVVIVSGMASSDEELSDGEILFEEKLVVFKNKGVESASKSSSPHVQGPQNSALCSQVTKVTEEEPREILVNSNSFMSLSSSADSEDWVLAGETPRIASAMACCRLLTPSGTFSPRKTLSVSSSMDLEEDMTETQTSSETTAL